MVKRFVELAQGPTDGEEPLSTSEEKRRKLSAREKQKENEAGSENLVAAFSSLATTTPTLAAAFPTNKPTESALDATNKAATFSASLISQAVAKSNHVTVEEKEIDWKKESMEMDKMFEEQAKARVLPLLEMPKQLKDDIEVLSHQKDGIRWMYGMEVEGKPSPFIYERTLLDGTIATYCRLTKRRVHNPLPLKGSILADDMGLGKTLQTIALVLANPPDEKATRKVTLIVCPKTVIPNWIEQVERFVKPGMLQTSVYSGMRAHRGKMIAKMKEEPSNMILVASYETVVADLSFRKKLATEEKTGVKKLRHATTKKTLGDLEFYRIVLDEAHRIRTDASHCFEAVTALTADFKHCLTGSPFVNKPDDIHSLLAFIGLEPLADKTTFEECITKPIMEFKRAGLTRLRTAMAYAAFRRTKQLVGLDFGEKTVVIKRVDWVDNDHKKIHDDLYKITRAMIIEDKQGNPKNLFKMVTRIRQSCCSGELVPYAFREKAAESAAALENLGSADDVASVLEKFHSLDLNSEAAMESLGPKLVQSQKINVLIDSIELLEHDEKAVIFSYFVSFLDLIQEEFESRGIECLRIDGSCSIEERIKVIQEFNRDDGPRFILCSTKACGEGINLTRGNNVFIMDPWWNQASESQSMDRVHRLGQTRPVRVTRFVMAGSIEDRLIGVQKAKAALGKGSLERLSAAEERDARPTAMKDLFEIGDDEDEDSFIDRWE